jgi:hypothetical protein
MKEQDKITMIKPFAGTIHADVNTIGKHMTLFADAIKEATIDLEPIGLGCDAVKVCELCYKISENIEVTGDRFIENSMLSQILSRHHHKVSHICVRTEMKSPYDYDKLNRKTMIELSEKLHCDIKNIIPISKEEYYKSER